MQDRISNLEDTIWEHDRVSHQDKWTVIEGKMHPEFLYLEDNKYKMEPISYLECDSGSCTSNEEILQELYSFMWICIQLITLRMKWKSHTF